jgi:Skp family chaperone for outer membrane proteins
MLFKQLIGCLLIGGMLAGPQVYAREKESNKHTITVLDVERIQHDAKAMLYIQKMVEQKRALFQKEVEAHEKELRHDKEVLDDLHKKQAPNYSEQQSLFDKKYTEVQKEVSKRSKILEEAFRNARSEVLQKLLEIAVKIAKDEGYELIVPKNLVIYSAGDEITDRVLKQLDTQLPKITINLPEGM